MTSTCTRAPEQGPSRFALRQFGAAVLALTLSEASTLVSPVAAQGRNVEDTKAIDRYRLTMPVLRKVLPALYAPGARNCPRAKDSIAFSLRS